MIEAAEEEYAEQQKPDQEVQETVLAQHDEHLEQNVSTGQNEQDPEPLVVDLPHVLDGLVGDRPFVRVALV